jgi:hypothetical protein
MGQENAAILSKEWRFAIAVFQKGDSKSALLGFGGAKR